MRDEESHPSGRSPVDQQNSDSSPFIHPSGPLMPTANGSDSSDLAASFEAETRRMSLGDKSGPLSGMPVGATDSSPPPVHHNAVASGERRNQIPVCNTGVRDSRGFLIWLRSRCPTGISAQMKGERFMAVPETADDFLAAIAALRFLGVSNDVNCHISLPEDRCVCLLVKNLGKRMPETVVREELEALGICVQGDLQLRSGRRDKGPDRIRPATPHFTVSVAGGQRKTVKSLLPNS